jgi:hypothetical protein
MVFMAGRLQRVETVVDSSDDEIGPPPLEDIEVPAGSVAVPVSFNDPEVESDDEPPALLSQSQSGSSDEEDEEEDDGSEAPPLADTEEESDDVNSEPPSASDGDDIPSLTGNSEEEGSEGSDPSDDELAPDLDDPDVSLALDATWKAMRHGQRFTRCAAFSSRGSSGSGGCRPVLHACLLNQAPRHYAAVQLLGLVMHTKLLHAFLQQLLVLLPAAPAPCVGACRNLMNLGTRRCQSWSMALKKTMMTRHLAVKTKQSRSRGTQRC